jgi:hypothetical protein
MLFDVQYQIWYSSDNSAAMQIAEFREKIVRHVTPENRQYVTYC